MSYNLIDETWIPVRRQSGATDWIAPWQITELADPPLFVDSPRPDFDATLTEFLIGLLQTTIYLKDTRAWRQLYKSPPSPAALREAFQSVAHAFDLFGAEARFLQDLSIRDDTSGRPVEELLIGQPGAITKKQNTDHFLHAGQVNALCEACTASAIYTLQAFGPAGGAGYRVSLRGGGPLSITVLGDNLAQTVILNLLVGWSRPPDLELVFPWLAQLRTSSQGEVVTPADGHELQAFWGQPNRVLVTPKGAERCDCCGRATERAVTSFWKAPYGVNYEGGWIHPLTPYRLTKEGVPLSVKGSTRGVPYSLWLDFVVPTEATRPPANVLALQQEQRLPKNAMARASGFDMDKMKARGWCAAALPVFHMPAERLNVFSATLRQMVDLASSHERALVSAIQAALKDRKKEAKSGASSVERSRLAFWARTERAFFDIAATLAKDTTSAVELKERWLRATEKACLAEFRSRVDLSAEIETRKIDRAASAYLRLRRSVAASSKKNRKTLDLGPLKKEKRKNVGNR